MKRNLIALLCIMLLTVLCLASCGCDHTFSNEWYSDETHHWHPATCEHAETERGDFGPHVDADEDGICEICHAPSAHVHTYEEAWQTDDSHHWRNPTCPQVGLCCRESSLSFSRCLDSNWPWKGPELGPYLLSVEAAGSIPQEAGPQL